MIAFVDTETTGLDPDRHEVWEVALLVYDTEAQEVTFRGWWHLPVDLGRADSVALRIGRYHERYTEPTPLAEFAADFAELTRGAHLAGAVVSFDEERLRKLLRANGACPEWHYHLIDVEAVAIGALVARGQQFALPWKSDDLTAALGVTISEEDRHTAYGDAWWALRTYCAAVGVKEPV